MSRWERIKQGGEAIADFAEHVDTNFQLCPIVCGTIGQQGGHPDVWVGEIGLNIGFSVGYSNREACDHEDRTVGGGGSAFIGGSYSVGWTGSDAVTDDWTGSLALGEVGVYGGAGRS